MSGFEAARLAAKRGAYWLDTVYPEWMSAIDLKVLDLSIATSCILGQVVGTHDRSGWTTFFNFVCANRSQEDYENYKDFIAEHGFEVPYDAADLYDYPELTEAWTELIEERL